MTFSFTRFKDRAAGTLNATSKMLGAAPRPVRSVGYGTLRCLLWLIYVVPRSHLRKTAGNFAPAVGQDNPRRLYAGFVDGLTRTAYRMELLGQGRGSEIDALLQQGIMLTEQLGAQGFPSLVLQYDGTTRFIEHSYTDVKQNLRKIRSLLI